MVNFGKILATIAVTGTVGCATTGDETTSEQLVSFSIREGTYTAKQIEAVAPGNSCAGIDLVFGDFQITKTGESSYAADESVGTSYECALSGRSADCGDGAAPYDIDYRPYGMDLYLVVTPHEGLTHQAWSSSTSFTHRFGARVTCTGSLCDEFFSSSLDESGCNLSTIAFFELAQ